MHSDTEMWVGVIILILGELVLCIIIWKFAFLMWKRRKQSKKGRKHSTIDLKGLN